jgi:hypothetical protein|tara:strand:+ start:721 stop:1554 length:834 start_codon:yes stop_codon:yes gene_type:complete
MSYNYETAILKTDYKIYTPLITPLSIANKALEEVDNLSKIIICQSIFRKWLVSRKNIYTTCKKFKTLQSTFNSVIGGYHMINITPIKESVWEEINCKIVSDVCSITDEANGNHVSGKDNRFDNINISNKSMKKIGNNVSMSSYRLTKVCSDKNNGNAQDIVKEINERNNSFDYYSILIRKETEVSIIEYNWYIIPKDYHTFSIDNLTHKIGKTGNKRGEIIGWKSNNCAITFSMSSQLWYNFNIEHINKYKVCSTKIDNSKSKINYAQIFDSFSNTI